MFSDLPGIGHSSESKLEKLNVRTCGDILSIKLDRLKNLFGDATGNDLHFYNRF
jgi:nucleotidyltransferase/DNA polymerase involved in DNA repair